MAADMLDWLGPPSEPVRLSDWQRRAGMQPSIVGPVLAFQDFLDACPYRPGRGEDEDECRDTRPDVCKYPR